MLDGRNMLEHALLFSVGNGKGAKAWPHAWISEITPILNSDAMVNNSFILQASKVQNV